MSKDSGSQAAGGADALLRVREILFGEQMAEVSRRFEEQAGMLQSLQSQLEELAARIEKRQAQSEEDFRQQLQALREDILARIAALDAKATARVDLGDMLIELGERLKQDRA